MIYVIVLTNKKRNFNMRFKNYSKILMPSLKINQLNSNNSRMKFHSRKMMIKFKKKKYQIFLEGLYGYKIVIESYFSFESKFE
jgi:hypothetical protein